jgi:prepilin-type N-terminal cleavage/methylation domain-containing protein/prepilin-type processing-associated H-X9-DG protein
MSRPSAADRAFTLMELLIVCAIIGLLLAILMPALTAVRKVAQTAGCANNLRQFMVTDLQWSADNRGYTLPAFYGWFSEPLWFHNVPFINDWGGKTVTAYTDFPRKMLCPTAKPEIAGGGVNSGLAYGINITCGDWWDIGTYLNNDWTKPVNRKLAAISDPANLVGVADALHFYLAAGSANPANGSGYWNTSGQVSPEGIKNDHVVAYRHRFRANAVFYDGHVALMAPADLYNSNLWKR